MNADIKAVGSASIAALVSPSASDAAARVVAPTATQKNSFLADSSVKENQVAAAPAPKVLAVESGGVLQFSVDSQTSQLVIKIVDGNTSEVIRKIPTDQLEAVVSQVRGVSGLIVNKTS